jgi:SAM-dependent MidA family methyltransferase
VSLRARIEQEIRECGPIPFSRYMELCLYDPELGYYSRNAEKFGRAGDFFTSSDVHAVFGRLLARQFEEMWRALGMPEQVELLEVGPGRGLFARDVLDWSAKKFPSFFRALHYTMVERCAALRQGLKTRLDAHLREGKVTIADCDNKGVPLRTLAADTPIIVFTNEFFDALPVEILSQTGSLRVNASGGRFVEEWAPASAAELEFLDHYGVRPEGGERTEVSLEARRYAQSLGQMIGHGFFIAIDYGYTREEQLFGRHLDTVMTYRQHTASPNPFEAPGEQDITAHVNFTALAAALEQHGMQAQPLLTQSQFLMGIGEEHQFADAFEECRLPQERVKVALQLKQLVTPAGMGETFHVLVASKDVPTSATEQLRGLSFGKSRISSNHTRTRTRGTVADEWRPMTED